MTKDPLKHGVGEAECKTCDFLVGTVGCAGWIDIVGQCLEQGRRGWLPIGYAGGDRSCGYCYWCPDERGCPGCEEYTVYPRTGCKGGTHYRPLDYTPGINKPISVADDIAAWNQGQRK